MCRALTWMIVVAASLGGRPGARAADQPASRPPNVLLIYTDDHGWADLGAQGVDADVQTPHLDQLAHDGVLCLRGYVTAPQCTPSRAGVITGTYQNRIGVEHNGVPLPAEAITLPERLQTAGYVTGISGKWHLDVESTRRQSGTSNRFLQNRAPQAQGFDEYFTGFLQDYSASHQLDGTPVADAPAAVRDDRCRVVLQTEAALSFLRRRARQPGQPWFLYLSYMAPHVPLESPEPWFSRTPDHLPLARRQALALIAAIDDGIGRIRELLREMGAEQRTLIFVIGDNGAPLGAPWNGSLNLPLKGQKGMLSEGGIRVPFVAAWPGTIPGGQKYDHPVISLDVAATALAQAGLPRDEWIDGVDLVPHLTGAVTSAPHETLYWRWMSQAAIQEFPHKLIVLGEDERLLFDITTPDGEDVARNLIARQPELAARLEAKLEAWCQTLTPAGMPPPLVDRHVQLFAEHALSRAQGPTGSAPSAGSENLLHWVCRGGTLTKRDGAVSIVAEPSVRPFIARTGLNLLGPVTVNLRVRATRGGAATVSWRSKTSGFSSEQSVTFTWPTVDTWQQVRVELPARERIIHVRIALPAEGEGIEVQRIELAPTSGQPAVTDFAGSGSP